MNLRRIVLILIAAMACHASFAQKDDGFFVTDPVKLVQVYPNPATEFVNIKFEGPEARKARIDLRNIIGSEQVLEAEIIDDYEIRVRVRDLATGYYFLAVRDEHANIHSTYKFLKR